MTEITTAQSILSADSNSGVGENEDSSQDSLIANVWQGILIPGSVTIVENKGENRASSTDDAFWAGIVDSMMGGVTIDGNLVTTPQNTGKYITFARMISFIGFSIGVAVTIVALAALAGTPIGWVVLAGTVCGLAFKLGFVAFVALVAFCYIGVKLSLEYVVLGKLLPKDQRVAACWLSIRDSQNKRKVSIGKCLVQWAMRDLQCLISNNLLELYTIPIILIATVRKICCCTGLYTPQLDTSQLDTSPLDTSPLDTPQLPSHDSSYFSYMLEKNKAQIFAGYLGLQMQDSTSCTPWMTGDEIEIATKEQRRLQKIE